MAVEVYMPKLGFSMQEGMVSTWHKKVGDQVSKGELIADISTDKIEAEVEAPEDGTVLDILVQEGEGVPPGTVICYIGKPGEKVAQEKSAAAQTVEVASSTIDSIDLPKTKKMDIKISPVARKMAEAAGLDLACLQGTGPGGRITKDDVEQAITKQCSSETQSGADKATEPLSPSSEDTESVEQIPVSNMRRVIATRMQESLQNSAQLTYTMKADVTDLMALRKQINIVARKEHGTNITVTSLIARAAILALKKHKLMNSIYLEDQISLFGHVHLGMAVALDTGLVVPVIFHAEKASLIDLSKDIKSLAERARAGQLSVDELQGSTFTISNLGGHGIEYFTPILNSPEPGILGVGMVEDVPVYKGEDLVRRSLLPLSLTCDHRIIDGAYAADFLRTIKNYLEEPSILLL